MKPIRTLLAMLVLAAGLGVALGPGTPAQAKCPDGPDCIPRYYYEVRFWWPDPPCYCPELVIDYLRDPRVRDVFGIDFEADRGLPGELLGFVAEGLAYFDQAAHAPDRALSARLHERGVAAFRAAAATLDGPRLRLRSVGDVDLVKHTFGPRAIDWLTVAGERLARGLNGLAEDPSPLPWAIAELDAAALLLIQGGAR